VLEAKLLPSAQDLFGANAPYIFQQDSALCHTAGKCIKWFQLHGVKLLQWPGNSPDLNLITDVSCSNRHASLGNWSAAAEHRTRDLSGRKPRR